MSLASFLASLAALDVPGVKTAGLFPPQSLNAADLPALWVQLPTLGDAAVTFQRGAYWPRLEAEVVIAVQPVAHNRPGEGWAAAVSMADNLSAALQLSQISQYDSWDIRIGIVSVAEVDYWAVIARVGGRG